MVWTNITVSNNGFGPAALLMVDITIFVGIPSTQSTDLKPTGFYREAIVFVECLGEIVHRRVIIKTLLIIGQFRY
jgi:hypothetical protein